ncbi:MAG: PA14 domain-containing protein [Polyangiaceae bacterium]
MQRASRNRPRLRALILAALTCVAGVLQTGCVETPTVVVVPDRFPIGLSPGVAPGEADGCSNDGPSAGRLLGRVYDIPLETRLLPDFDALSPVEAVCLDRLEVTPRRSVYPGFPGLRDRFRWFAVDLQGLVQVDEPGVFDFRLTSDDGSQLYVDDALVVDNDGYHPTRMALGAAHLSGGKHALRVGYWQGPGPMALVLEVARPGDAYHVLQMDRPM